MKSFFLISALLISSIVASVQAMNNDQYSEANALYLAAVNGDDEDLVLQAIKYIDQLKVNKPYDSLIKSYRGSLESMMSAHVFMPWTKMKHAEIGAEQMDDALDEMTEIHDATILNGTSLSILIRLNIAHTYFQFPRFLNRYQDAKDLVAEIIESPQFSSATLEIKNNVYKLAADMAAQDGDKLRQTELIAKIQSVD